MKYILFTLALIVYLAGTAQEPRYQTYSTALTVLGTKNDTDIEWTNKNINIVLNYKTGDFKATLKESDFANSTKKNNQENLNMFGDGNVFTLTGIFPINELLNQQQTTASYSIELQLQNEDGSLFESILFNTSVTKPGEGQLNYRIFVLTGTLQKQEFDLPVFEGMDNELSI